MAGDGHVIKLQNLCFKFPFKKISCKDREIKKKNPAGLEQSKKISSSLKILQPPHQKSNGPPLNYGRVMHISPQVGESDKFLLVESGIGNTAVRIQLTIGIQNSSSNDKN